MVWLIAIVAMIVGVIIGWWLAKRTWEQQNQTASEGAVPKTAQTAAAVVREAGAEAIAEPDPDDLITIEGVGPKIAELLNMGGIYTFAELSDTRPDRIKEILLVGGERFRMHDPGTWPEQARLAAAGNWDELQVLQDELDGGRPA